MKRLAIYGRVFSEEHSKSIERFFEILQEHQAQIDIYEPFSVLLKEKISLNSEHGVFHKEDFQANNYDVMLSIGGDGTLLDTTTFVKDSQLPILGLNTGRLGFLSSINLGNVWHGPRNTTNRKNSILSKVSIWSSEALCLLDYS